MDSKLRKPNINCNVHPDSIVYSYTFKIDINISVTVFNKIFIEYF